MLNESSQASISPRYSAELIEEEFKISDAQEQELIQLYDDIRSSSC